MRIEAIRLENFKAFRKVDLTDIPPFCVLVGANGSGKSTLFDVFGFLKDCLTHNVKSAVQKRGGMKELLSRNSGSKNLRLEIKFRMAALCRVARHPDALVRVACHEIESWYLGDLEAVGRAFGIRGLGRLQGKRRYRNPDRLANAWEEMRKVTGEIYQNIAGSRAIGAVLDPDGPNRSHSFRVFITGVRRVVDEALSGV